VSKNVKIAVALVAGLLVLAIGLWFYYKKPRAQQSVIVNAATPDSRPSTSAVSKISGAINDASKIASDLQKAVLTFTGKASM
jgi:uncharacterized protein (UPF0333 family)